MSFSFLAANETKICLNEFNGVRNLISVILTFSVKDLVAQ